VHALQLELSEATYMDETPPYAYREDLAQRLQPQLKTLLELFLSITKWPRTRNTTS
jgi:N-formylglutamate amidohydrolase